MGIELATYTITLNAFEAGILMGMIEKDLERLKDPLSKVRDQLIAIKRHCEEVAGVVKKILPNGMLELTDGDGNVIIRSPYSWEVEDN